MKTRKSDRERERLQHEVDSINFINDWRNEEIKHAVYPHQKEAVDKKVFEFLDRIARAALSGTH